MESLRGSSQANEGERVARDRMNEKYATYEFPRLIPLHERMYSYTRYFTSFQFSICFRLTQTTLRTDGHYLGVSGCYDKRDRADVRVLLPNAQQAWCKRVICNWYAKRNPKEP